MYRVREDMVYEAFYALRDPVAQLRAAVADVLRSNVRGKRGRQEDRLEGRWGSA